MEVVIVGGGLAGLAAALSISRMKHVKRVQVLEAKDRVGGRMRTHYGPDDRPLYEEGAWRISQEHRRMLNLCTELGLELLEVASEGAEAERAWLGPGSPREVASTPACAPGTLSTWDAVAVRRGPQAADLQAATTGYAGLDVMVEGSDAYGVESREAGARDRTRYYVPFRGMSSICAQLYEELQRTPRCRVHLTTRVVDVRPASGGYTVLYEERVGGNAFSGASIWADAVVVACPPSQVTRWGGVARPLAPLLAALSSVPLLKVFADAGAVFGRATGLRDRPFHFKANTLSQQLISNTYPDTGFVQLAYCAGRRAEALERLHLCGDLQRALVREVLGALALPSPEEAELQQALLASKLTTHFWSEAVHVWNPSYKLDVPLKSAQACLAPHASLPDLYLCGEAFSPTQGWGEGALQTVEWVTDALRTRGADAQASPPIPRSLFPGPGESRALLVYDGRLLDVAAWAKVHPGGEAAIKGHLGEDVTALWQSILHSRSALGLIFALQVGWSTGCLQRRSIKDRSEAAH